MSIIIYLFIYFFIPPSLPPSLPPSVGQSPLDTVGEEITYLFLRIGVNLGSKSLMGGVILFMPITLTIAYKPKATNNLADKCRKYILVIHPILEFSYQ